MMIEPAFSYRHLYYLWVVGREGGITRAASRLGVAAQTVSTQVRELEKKLGFELLAPAGRGVRLTEAGLAAIRQAEQIFQLGEQLPTAVRDAAGQPSLRLSVGVSDGLPKLVVHRLMQAVIGEQHLRLFCHTGDLEDLLGELALHRLDVVLADRPAPANPNLRLYSHPLDRSGVAWYAPASLAASARRQFPRSLAHVPVLLPAPDAAVRSLIDRWLERVGVKPKLVGEFTDSALLKAFGANGMGVFPAVRLVHDDLIKHYGVRPIGSCAGVEEHFYAIATERRIQHRLVQRLVSRAE